MEELNRTETESTVVGDHGRIALEVALFGGHAEFRGCLENPMAVSRDPSTDTSLAGRPSTAVALRVRLPSRSDPGNANDPVGTSAREFQTHRPGYQRW